MISENACPFIIDMDASTLLSKINSKSTINKIKIPPPPPPLLLSLNNKGGIIYLFIVQDPWISLLEKPVDFPSHCWLDKIMKTLH